MGTKIGLNGIDHGLIRFDNYKVGKNALLNRFSDIDSNGNYKLNFGLE
jgi:acyl-CoA oxidase